MSSKVKPEFTEAISSAPCLPEELRAEGCFRPFETRAELNPAKLTDGTRLRLFVLSDFRSECMPALVMFSRFVWGRRYTAEAAPVLVLGASRR